MFGNDIKHIVTDSTDSKIQFVPHTKLLYGFQELGILDTKLCTQFM